MTIIHSDRFTEASTTALESHTPDIGSGYTKTYGPTQNVGAGTGEVAFVTSESVYKTNIASTSADGYVEAVMSGTSFAVIYFREQGAVDVIGECYCWLIFPSYSKLTHRSAGGTVTDIGATDSTPLINMSVSSQTFKVVYTGNTFDFYLDGVFKYSRTDSTLNTAGRVSIDANAGVALLDLIVDGGAAGGTTPGIAAETDTALALAGKQIRAAGMATETDTALALVTLAGLPFNTAPYEFGQRTGLDVDDFSIYASTSLNVSVYAATDVLLASQLFAYTESTGSDGRLTRKTHASLTAGTVYIFVAVTTGGALVAAGRITAT